MKHLYETTGQFQLSGPGQFVSAWRPACLEGSHFLQQFMASGRLRILGQVNDEATDAEFETYWNEAKGDKELAVSSFLAAFPLPGTEPAPVAKPRGRKGDAE